MTCAYNLSHPPKFIGSDVNLVEIIYYLACLTYSLILNYIIICTILILSSCEKSCSVYNYFSLFIPFPFPVIHRVIMYCFSYASYNYNYMYFPGVFGFRSVCAYNKLVHVVLYTQCTFDF